MPQIPSRRSMIKEYPASPEVVDQWKNKIIYNKRGTVKGFVRSVFLRQGFNNRTEIVTWLVVRWTDKNITSTISTREGNLKLREDGHYQIA